MYEKHFQLQGKPFQLTADPDYFFPSAGHNGALHFLEHAVSTNAAIVLLTGKAGTGKTSLCLAFLENLEPGIETAYIDRPKNDAAQLIQAIHAAYGLDADLNDPEHLLDSLKAFLSLQKHKEKKCLLIIDDAHQLEASALEQIRLLSDAASSSGSILSIILSGDPQLDRKLKTNDLRRLDQRISLRREIKPMGPVGTRQYIQHRLNIAAPLVNVKFCSSASRLIHLCSGGVPRLINKICENALVTAYGENKKKITRSVVMKTLLQLTNKQHNLFLKMCFVHNMPLFWCVAVCIFAAFVLICTPMAINRLYGEAVVALPSPPSASASATTLLAPTPVIDLVAVHEPGAKGSLINSETINADQGQPDGSDPNADRSTPSPNPAPPPPSGDSDMRTDENRPETTRTGYQKDSEDVRTLPADHGPVADKPTPSSDPTPPPPSGDQAHRAHKNRLDETHVDFQKAIELTQVPAKPSKHKPLPSVASDGPIAGKSVAAPIAKSEKHFISPGKKREIWQSPCLIMEKIDSGKRPVSEDEFLDYLSQIDPKSNREKTLLYAIQLWRHGASTGGKLTGSGNDLNFFNQRAKANGLAIYSTMGSLNELERLNLPAILEFQHPRQALTRYLVVKNIDYQMAILSNGESNGVITIALDQLNRFWSGVSYILWKKVIQSADIIRPDSPPAAIRELNAFLTGVGLVTREDLDTYASETVTAVKQIQARFGIPPTGVVDIATHAVFNRYLSRIRRTGRDEKT